jgi:hypothetical protein
VRPHTGPQVEHPDPGKRAIGRRQRLRRGFSDPVDREERKARDRATLRMRIPLGERAAHRNHEAGLGGRLLERFCAPSSKHALDRWLIVAAAEQREHPVAVMRQIRMQAHPAAVTAAIEASDRVMIFRARLGVDAQVAFAAKLDRGAAHVDAHALATAGAQPPQLAGGECRSRDGRLRRGADCE